MPDDKNRNRQIQVKFFVSEKELAAIKQRMTKFGADNLSAYLRTMARLHPRGRAAKSGTGMTEIMPVPRNLNFTVLPAESLSAVLFEIFRLSFVQVGWCPSRQKGRK